jgi:glycosyltransferase involved in cell wall biosynthesis
MKGSFVQIHYHNRPGGVAEVMERYAAAFLAAGGDRGAAIVVCEAQAEARCCKVVDVKDCGYRTFQSRASFAAARAGLLSRLETIVTSPGLPAPVRIVGHNMNLCKNAALSSAFAGLARRLQKNSGKFRFFSVVHDFAEEGRTDLMEQTGRLERRGIRLWDDLYPALPNLCFVAVSPRNLRILARARYPVRLVYNPVDIPAKQLRSPGRPAALRRLERAAFDDRMPTIFYPARIVSRKNPVEAILLAHFVFSSNLLLGEDGTSSADEGLAVRLRRLCARHGIRAVFDSGRLMGPGGKNQASAYSRLYSTADACISTSVLEGFGYGLYEPWLHDKALVGRIPAGAAPGTDVDLSGMYRRLLVPREWVDEAGLKRRYHAQMRVCVGPQETFPAFEPFSRQFDRAFVRGRGIDFGCLDSATQCAILECLCKKPSLVSQWKREFPAQTGALAQSLRAALQGPSRRVAHNRRHVAARLGPRAFAASFSKVFFGKPASPDRSRPRVADVRKQVCTLGAFRLLATPHAGKERHYCTIFA